MKKKFSTIAVVVVAFLLTVTGVYAAMHWEGTENVGNIKDNLALIQIKMDELKTENGGSKETIRKIEILLEQEQALREQRERELVGKQTEIENKNAEIQEKVAENDLMKQQLDQALRDVKDIEQITKDMLE